VGRWLDAPLQDADFATGSARFDGEWRFGAVQMAALGYAGLLLEHPEQRERWLPRLRQACDQLLHPDLHRFDEDAWGQPMLGALADPSPRQAVLGYLNLALGAERLVDPEGPHAHQHDAISRALLRRVEQAAGRPIATYPGEAYPVDMSAVYASLLLWRRSTSAPPDPAVVAALETWGQRYVGQDGLLVQAVHPDTGAPRSPARASGTALAAAFLAWGDPARARVLAEGLRQELDDSVVGFGAVREYPRGMSGQGDIDSGPLIGPWSISGTGFSLGAARALGDADWYRRLCATTWIWGLPGPRSGYATGGALGNAILFAMMQVPRGEAT
jgi:hypothetical protein